MLNDIVCNCCGKRLDFFDRQQGITIHKPLTYGSEFDGDYISLFMCNDCLDNLIRSCKVSPICTKEGNE